MTETFKHETREAWLQAAVTEMRVRFQKVAEVKIPDVRVSTGWSKRSGKAIGWCWKTDVTKDMVNQIFISPEIEDPVMVLATLLHELVHASDNGESGHSGYFRQTAKAMGLEGAMTATTPGEELIADLQKLAGELGPYPHSKISPVAKIGTQGTRMIKIVCPEDGYTVRTTKKWIDQGLPTCSCGTEMELAQ